MNVGDTVYLRWYDFRTGAENVYTGTVVDNSLWEGTRWQDYVNVQFQPVGMKAPICHHFLPEKLSTVNDNVPHDNCWLVYGKMTVILPTKPAPPPMRTNSKEIDIKQAIESEINMTKINPMDFANAFSLGLARTMLKDFMKFNWDEAHNHIMTDKLDEYYQLWRTVKIVELGMTEYQEPAKRIVSDSQMAELKERLTAQLEQEAKPQADVKPQPTKRKKKKSESNVTQLSLF